MYLLNKECSRSEAATMWTTILSLELGGGVDISLECSIDNICTNIYHIWHNWLVLGTVPRYITRLS